MVSLPRPAFPPVTKMTLPERSGTSLSGLKDGMFTSVGASLNLSEELGGIVKIESELLSEPV